MKKVLTINAIELRNERRSLQDGRKKNETFPFQIGPRFF